MRLNTDYLQELMIQRGWKPAHLAKALKVTRSSISRILNGSRGAGKTMIGKIIRVFPNEPIDKLFFLSEVSLNGIKNSKKNNKAG